MLKRKTHSSDVIASHFKRDLLRAGSFPAASLANVLSVDRVRQETFTLITLISNDIDVYYDKFAQGVI